MVPPSIVTVKLDTSNAEGPNVPSPMLVSKQVCPASAGANVIIGEPPSVCAYASASRKLVWLSNAFTTSFVVVTTRLGVSP